MTAVDDVSLEIADHDFVVLVGPSGCGKSTTLRMVAGLEDVDRGSIYIGDRLVNDVAPKDRDIAMVFQSYALYPHMNVYDNMAFALRLRRVEKEEVDRRVRDAAGTLGILDLLKRFPKEISGGQKQRAALGRALVREPAVFLMDEPLSNLDAKLRVQMRAEIADLHRRLEATVIYVTHDQTEAMTMGNRIAVMKDGRIHQAAPPREIYDRPANMFVAGFIGTPPMNFLRCRVAGGRLQVDGFSLAVSPERQAALGAFEGKEIVLGVRPEDISAASGVAAAAGRSGPASAGAKGGPGEVAPASGRAASPPGAVVEGRVALVELLGAETNIHVALADGQFLTARAPAEAAPRYGDRLRAALRMGRAHLFDPATEEAVT